MSTVIRYFAAIAGAGSIPQYITLCRVIVTKMTGNASLSTPPIPLPQVTSHINDLDTAEQAVVNGPKGAAKDRNTKLRVVQSDMRQLKAYVQSVCDANITDSQAIIVSAGMSVAKKVIRPKPAIGVRYGKAPTTVALYCKAKKGKASYLWQMSGDQKTWTDLPPTVTAATSVTGLTSATVYYFRLRILTVDGLSDWSMVVSIIAH